MCLARGGCCPKSGHEKDSGGLECNQGPPDNNSIRAGRRARSPAHYGRIRMGQGYRCHDGTGGKQHNIRLAEILYFLHATVSAGGIPTSVNGPFGHPRCSETGQLRRDRDIAPYPHGTASASLGKKGHTARGRRRSGFPTACNLALTDTLDKLVNHDGRAG